MKTKISPIVGLLLWTMSSLIALCDGVGSFNKVTSENINALAHHKLNIGSRTSDGLTTISLKVDADKDHHLEGGAFITIRSKAGDTKPPLVIFDLNPDGVSKCFSVATDQLSNVSITYRLRENKGLLCHVFDIDAGELTRLAANNKTAEQAVDGNPH